MKRICLFAGYNYKNKISQYVIDYLKELSNYCDIYYLADGSVDVKEFELIKVVAAQNSHDFNLENNNENNGNTNLYMLSVEGGQKT